jgi:hypothetical protein
MRFHVLTGWAKFGRLNERPHFAIKYDIDVFGNISFPASVYHARAPMVSEVGIKVGFNGP